jgi:hypothetical protein
MPIPSALNDLWQVKMVGRQEGQETNNIWYFSCVGADTDVTTNLIIVLADCFIAHMLPVLCNQWSIEKFVYQRVAPTLGAQYEYIPTGTLSGGGGGDVLPSYASLVFNERGLRGGRSRRGRFSLAGIPEGATNGSKFDPTHAFWAGAVAFAACVVAAFYHADPAGGSSIYDLVVYSRKIGGSHFPPTSGSDSIEAVNSITPNLVLGTIRSRKLGRGV